MSLGFDGDLLYEKLLVEESRTKERKVLRGAEAMRAFARGLGRLLREGRKLQGKTSFQNLPISIENKKGSIRKGTDPDGDEWKTKMKVPYGYIPGTKGADGDELDTFVGPEEDAAFAYIVHSNDPETGKFDEDKVMLGFKDKTSAKRCFLQHYDSPEFFGGMDEIPMWKFQDKVWVKKETSKRLVASVRRVRESQEYGVKGMKWGVRKAGDTEDVRKRGEKTSIGSFSSAQNFVRAAIKEKGLSYVVSEKGMEEVMGRVLGRRGYDSFVGAMSAYLIKDTKGPLERAALKVESGRADDSVSKGLMLLKAITQETLPKDSSVTLYRGVGGDYATAVKKEGSSPISVRERLSSFTSDLSSAKKFAKSSAFFSKLGGESADSAVLSAKVPANTIYASPKTWSTTPGSKEYLVFPKKLTAKTKESVFLEFGVKGQKWGVRKRGDKKGKVPVGKLRVQTEEYTDALNITLRDQSGVRVGKIEFEALDARAGEEGYQPRVLELNYVQVAPQFRGKGFGKKLYIKGFEKAAKYGAKVVRSDPEGMRAVSADNVWKSLRKMFPNSVTSVGSMDAQYFRVDLSRFSGERRKSKESQEYGVRGMRWGEHKDEPEEPDSEELAEDPEEEEEEEEEEIAEELGDVPYEDDVDEEPEEDDAKESRRTREGGIYYARSLQSYGTDQEADDLDFLESEFEDEDIIALESCDRKRTSGMKYFHKKVEESDVVVISPRRKKKGKYRVTAGVWSEARHAMKKGIPVRMLRKGKLHEVKSLKIRKNPKAAGDFADVVLKRRRGG